MLPKMNPPSMMRKSDQESLQWVKQPERIDRLPLNGWPNQRLLRARLRDELPGILQWASTLKHREQNKTKNRVKHRVLGDVGKTNFYAGYTGYSHVWWCLSSTLESTAGTSQSVARILEITICYVQYHSISQKSLVSLWFFNVFRSVPTLPIRLPGLEEQLRSAEGKLDELGRWPAWETASPLAPWPLGPLLDLLGHNESISKIDKIMI